MKDCYNHGIFGTVCGDVIGSPYEAHCTKDMDFELFRPNTRFTDDTVMTCAVAKWLMEDPNHTRKALVEQMQWFGREFPHRGYGSMFKQWIVSDDPQPYGSIGNGSGMRVSPVGFYADTLEEALELAQISAEVTHDSVEGIAGAQAVAVTIFMLRHGERVADIKKYLSDHFAYDMDRTSDEIAATYSFQVSCALSVPEAIICALEVVELKDDEQNPCEITPEHYIQAVRSAVSLGGDADTQAAMAGGIMCALTTVPDDVADYIANDILDPLLLSVIEDFNQFLENRKK